MSVYKKATVYFVFESASGYHLEGPWYKEATATRMCDAMNAGHRANYEEEGDRYHVEAFEVIDS